MMPLEFLIPAGVGVAAIIIAVSVALYRNDAGQERMTSTVDPFVGTAAILLIVIGAIGLFGAAYLMPDYLGQAMTFAQFCLNTALGMLGITLYMKFAAGRQSIAELAMAVENQQSQIKALTEIAEAR